MSTAARGYRDLEEKLPVHRWAQDCHACNSSMCVRKFNKQWYCTNCGRYHVSLNLSSGYVMKRKDKDGLIVDWKPESSKARVQMLPFSYLEKETAATKLYEELRKGI